MYYILLVFSFLFFFNDTAPTEIYTLSLHDALPICPREVVEDEQVDIVHHALGGRGIVRLREGGALEGRSEEHTSELQSQSNLVCRLLLEKKKKTEYHYKKSYYIHNVLLYHLLYNIY